MTTPAPSKPGRLRRLLLNAIVLGISVVVGLVLIEIGLRLVDISYPIFETWDDERAIALRPGKEGWYRHEGEAYLSINRWGYRDIDVSKDKPAGTFRIVVLGDSFTEARQVALEDTFIKALERNEDLKKAVGNRTIEALNFGVGGYGNAQALLTLRKDALQFNPDWVLLTLFVGNDFVNNSKELSLQAGDAFRPFFLLDDENQLALDLSFATPSPRLYRKWFLLTAIHSSRLLELVNQARRNYLIQQMQAAEGPSSAEAAPLTLGTYTSVFVPPTRTDWQQAWAVTERLIEQIQDDAKAAGAQFALVVAPTAISAHPDREARTKYMSDLGVTDLAYPDRRLAAHGQERDYLSIPLTEAFREWADSTEGYLYGFKNTAMGFGHWNEEGHRQAALRIGKAMARRIATSTSTHAPE